MTATLVTDALNMAAWMRRHSTLENLTCHNDVGQCTSVTYTDRLDDHGAGPSIGTVGDAYDNAMAESMFSLIQTELIHNPGVLADYGGHWKGLDDLETSTCKWVSWFNEARIHGELGDPTPVEVEANYIRQSQVNAAGENLVAKSSGNTVRIRHPTQIRLHSWRNNVIHSVEGELVDEASRDVLS
jgi:putative transposase